ncbi:hypothetical protein N0V85_008786 [Neurospora sp. IMI 360204]|nr:hypothetical protein N0V85_008786 [Neurospora sp. IMI 360204]
MEVEAIPSTALGQGNKSVATPEPTNEVVEIPKQQFYEELAQRVAQKLRNRHAARIRHSPSSLPANAHYPQPHLNNAYRTPYPSFSTPKVDVEYDADTESDTRIPTPASNDLNSYLRVRNRLILEIKIARKANERMCKELRRLESSRSYHNLVMEGLEAELAMLKKKGNELGEILAHKVTETAKEE